MDLITFDLVQIQQWLHGVLNEDVKSWKGRGMQRECLESEDTAIRESTFLTRSLPDDGPSKEVLGDQISKNFEKTMFQEIRYSTDVYFLFSIGMYIVFT